MPNETAAPNRPGAALEALRWLLVAAAGATLSLPMLTDRFVGGTDARWYFETLWDYLQQLRAGHHPILQGEGPFAWNGGVHPFRSAPMYMMLAGAWDWVSGGRFSPLLLQHLTVATSAFLGPIACYGGLRMLLPSRRWTAVLLTLLYLQTPAWIGVLVGSEAYMSYLAFAVVPLVLAANLRAALAGGWASFVGLGLSLALVWNCHPPIAAEMTLVSLVLQVAAVLVVPEYPFCRAMLAPLTLAGTGAYYFAAMSEVPPRVDNPPLASALAVGGMSLFVVGWGLAVLRARSRLWLLAALAGAAMAYAGDRPWALCIVAAAALSAAAARFHRGRTGASFDGAALEVMAASLIAGACVVVLIAGREHKGWDWNVNSIQFVRSNLAELPKWLKPVNFSPYIGLGSGVGLCIAAAVLGGPWVRTAGARILAAAAAAVLVCAFPLGYPTDVAVGYFPPAAADVMNLGLSIRVLPVLASVGVFGAAAVLAAPALQRRGVRLWTLGVLALALVAAGIQTQSFHRIVSGYTQDPASTPRFYLASNVRLSRYDYDLVKVPEYLSDGISDARIENRLVAADGTILADANAAAAACEARTAVSVPLITHVWYGQDRWYQFDPRVRVPAGGAVLLRFEFDPALDYSGYLFFISEHMYREYLLPRSGFTLAFGTAKGCSRILLLTNSTDATETFAITYRASSGSIAEGARFAQVTQSTWDPALVPVSLDSLSPLAVRVRAQRDCFLETCRVFLPGYHATVDAVAVPVGESSQHLVQVPVKAGEHRVVLTYEATPRVRRAMRLTEAALLCSLLALLAAAILRCRQPPPESVSPA